MWILIERDRETEMFDCEIASAAINDIHMNQAYKNIELKSWIGEDNSVTPDNIRHHLPKFDPSTVMRMFRQVSGVLFDIVFEERISR